MAKIVSKIIISNGLRNGVKEIVQKRAHTNKKKKRKRFVRILFKENIPSSLYSEKKHMPF